MLNVGPPPKAVREIRTERLILRQWRDEDLEPFTALNRDPLVMEFFPALLSAKESEIILERVRAHFIERGFGFWAVEVPEVAPFIGFIGLGIPTFRAPFTPCVEIGWRLARPYWGRGYATEGARASLMTGFTALGLEEIVSFTVPANVRSRQVMEKLQMRRSAEDDFDHPRLPPGHPLRRHMLYRISRREWQRNSEDATSGDFEIVH